MSEDLWDQFDRMRQSIGANSRISYELAEALTEGFNRVKAERDEAFAKGKQAFEDLRRVEAKINALAAHVERLHDGVKRYATHGSEFTIIDLIDRVNESPETSLARVRGEVRRQVAEEWELGLPRLKAGWQAAALETAVITAQMKGETEVARWLQGLADTFRRQAEGEHHD